MQGETENLYGIKDTTWTILQLIQATMSAVMKTAVTMEVTVIMIWNNSRLILFPCSACTWHDIGKRVQQEVSPTLPIQFL